MKIFEKINNNYTKKIKILGITIYKKYYYNGCGYIKILFFQFKYKNFLKEYVRNLKTSYKKINIALVNAGESFIFAISADNISKNTLWVLEQHYTKEIFESYAKTPQPVILLNNIKFGYILRTLKKTHYQYNDIDINIYYPQFFWNKFWTNIPPRHYIEIYKDIFKFDVQRIKLTQLEVSNDVKNNINNLISSWAIDVNKLIILFPEAASINNIPCEFWLKVIDRLKSLGFSVFVNSINPFWLNKNVILTIKNGRQVFLNLNEIYYLTSLSKKVLGIRSGYLELLLSNDINMFVLYNNSHTFPDQDVQKLYTLKKYPKNDKIIITEENYTKEAEEILLTKILTNFK